MVAAKEFSWEEVSSPDFGSRAAWRAAVADIAAKAKETLPECNGRVDAAVKIVLAGDVELLEGGTAKVASQSNGTTVYHVVNGECTCKDFPRAPSGWCKHRIATGLAKRVAARVRTQLDAPANGQVATPSQPTPTQASPAVPASPLPEVPAIVSTTITVAGRRVEVKLCDTDDARLLVRLQAILAQYPSAPPAATPPTMTPPPAAEAPPTCPMHGVPMRQQTNAKGSWWSHQTASGWCKGK